MGIAAMNEPVISNIQRVIDQNGLKQRVLAEKAGFTVYAVSDMLNGRRIIKPCEIPRIADALGVDVAALFMKEEVHDTDS